MAWNQAYDPEPGHIVEGSAFYRVEQNETCSHCQPSRQNGSSGFSSGRATLQSAEASSILLFNDDGDQIAPCVNPRATQKVRIGSNDNMELMTLQKSAVLHVAEHPKDRNSSPRNKLVGICLRVRRIRSLENGEDWIHARATVMMYLEILQGNGGSQDKFWTNLIRQLDGSSLCGHCQKNLTIELAHALANGRTWHVSNACVALVLYAWQVIGSFWTVVGGIWSSVPGGRIGLAVMYHLLVPAVLLSSTVGSFPTRTFCRQTIEAVAAKYGCDLNRALHKTYEDSGRIGSIAQDVEMLSSMGRVRAKRDGNGVYRRATTMDSSDGQEHGWFYFRDRPHWYLFILATLPVATSCACSFAALWFLPPTGPNPRLYLVCSVTVMFFISTAIASTTRNIRWISDRGHMWISLVKDICIGSSSLVTIVLACCGLFNSCRAWSGVWLLHEKAYISLNNNAAFEANVKKRYPIVFSVCIGVELAWFALIVFLQRTGFARLRWSAKTRERVLAMKIEKQHDGTKHQESLEDYGAMSLTDSGLRCHEFPDLVVNRELENLETEVRRLGGMEGNARAQLNG
jgi:hypothetical protein